MKPMKTMFAPALTVFLFACGPVDDTDDHEEEVTPVDDACEHMVSGPSQSLTATDEMGDAPAVADSHTRYDVSLSPGDDTFGGLLLFESADASDAHFFVDDPLARITLLDGDGQEVASDETITEAPCDEVGIGWAWALEVGTYVLDVTAEDDTVGIVYVPADAEHEHEE